MRKRVWVGTTAVAAASAVGIGAMALGGGSTLASNTVPTSQVAASTSATVSPTPPKTDHRHFGFGAGGRSVYSASVISKAGGGYATIISVHGPLITISPTSISVQRPDSGAIVTASISSTTKFGNTTEAALAGDLSPKTAVNVMMVETGGVAKVVVVPPAPGTRPKFPVGPMAGRFGQSNSSGSASASSNSTA